VPKVVVVVVVILIIAYIVANPSQSADMVHAGWAHAKDIAHGLGDFVNQLAS
jgi:hypothetical protein